MPAIAMATEADPLIGLAAQLHLEQEEWCRLGEVTDIIEYHLPKWASERPRVIVRGTDGVQYKCYSEADIRLALRGRVIEREAQLTNEAKDKVYAAGGKPSCENCLAWPLFEDRIRQGKAEVERERIRALDNLIAIRQRIPDALDRSGYTEAKRKSDEAAARCIKTQRRICDTVPATIAGAAILAAEVADMAKDGNYGDDRHIRAAHNLAAGLRRLSGGVL